MQNTFLNQNSVFGKYQWEDRKKPNYLIGDLDYKLKTL